MGEVVLSMKHITKRFNNVVALDDVNLELYSSEVLCLLGENGAGKSTLLKILSAAYKRDGGIIEIDGKEVHFKTTRQAIESGIAVIYQELNEIPDLTVAENIYLERQPVRGPLKRIDWQRMVKDAEALFSEIGIDIDPRRRMKELSVAEKQMTEIAKAVAQNIRILVTDEPTSALSEAEVNKLFGVIDRIKRMGGAIIFISHRLDEVMRISDRIMVLRDGKNVGVVKKEETSEEEIVTMMVGRKLVEMFPRRRHEVGNMLLEAEKLTAKGIQDISFQLHKGEILGVFGLMGSGIQKLGTVLFGKDKWIRGHLRLNGKPVNYSSPCEAIAQGVAFVPSERKIDGIIACMSVKENIVLASMTQSKPRFLLNHSCDRMIAEKWKERLRIKTPDIRNAICNLSGGNQQKTVISRWLEMNPEVLILAEPTRGIDVGAKAEIYELMEEYARSGGSVILITSEMREILEMSDRILVLHDGEMNGVLVRSEADEEKLLLLAMGGTLL